MSDIRLAEAFPAPTHEQWRALVDRVLKGGDFERRLVSKTTDGLRIDPLYVRKGTTAGRASISGRHQYDRGGMPTAGRSGWDIRQPCEEHDPAAANAALLEDLTGGVSSVSLAIAAPGHYGLPYGQDDLARALQGVQLDVCPVHLVAGEYTPDAAGSLMALWRHAGLVPEKWRGGFGYDPLGTLARTGALYHPLPRALHLACELVAMTQGSPHLTALEADGQVWHLGGATEAQELAAILAGIVEVLRAAECIGTTPVQALPKIAVTVAVDADQFLGIAKLRAVRMLVSRIARACGADAASPSVSIAAETSTRMLTRRDPWVNILRNTIACSAAALGGADAITVLPFTRALGKADVFARRMARNTQLVLMDESALERVADPAGGSWYIESLTSDLAARAWEVFQTIEAKGGLAAVLTSGWWQDELLKSAEERSKSIASGRVALTGTSAFPKLGDDGLTVDPWPEDIPSAALNGARARPLAQRRDSVPFEALRDAADAFAQRAGKPPRVFLASLGPLAVHATRTTWMRNFLAAGGIATVEGEGFTGSVEAGRAFAESECTVACLCSSDETYAELGDATASLLKTAGCTRLYLAGRPREQENALRAAGVDGFIYAGIDAVATLQRLQRELGV